MVRQEPEEAAVSVTLREHLGEEDGVVSPAPVRERTPHRRDPERHERPQAVDQSDLPLVDAPRTIEERQERAEARERAEGEEVPQLAVVQRVDAKEAAGRHGERKEGSARPTPLAPRPPPRFTTMSHAPRAGSVFTTHVSRDANDVGRVLTNREVACLYLVRDDE